MVRSVYVNIIKRWKEFSKVLNIFDGDWNIQPWLKLIAFKGDKSPEIKL